MSTVVNACLLGLKHKYPGLIGLCGSQTLVYEGVEYSGQLVVLDNANDFEWSPEQRTKLLASQAHLQDASGSAGSDCMNDWTALHLGTTGRRSCSDQDIYVEVFRLDGVLLTLSDDSYGPANCALALDVKTDAILGFTVSGEGDLSKVAADAATDALAAQSKRRAASLPISSTLTEDPPGNLINIGVSGDLDFGELSNSLTGSNVRIFKVQKRFVEPLRNIIGDVNRTTDGGKFCIYSHEELTLQVSRIVGTYQGKNFTKPDGQGVYQVKVLSPTIPSDD